MAYANTQEASFVAIATLRVVDAVSEVKNSIVAWKEERATRKILRDLTDEQLEDIGLTRGDMIVSAQSDNDLIVTKLCNMR